MRLQTELPQLSTARIGIVLNSDWREPKAPCGPVRAEPLLSHHPHHSPFFPFVVHMASFSHAIESNAANAPSVLILRIFSVFLFICHLFTWKGCHQSLAPCL
jgi:hypothetical protein